MGAVFVERWNKTFGGTNKARQHASSCTVAPLLDPMEAMFLSILVEQQKEISSLREAISMDGRTVILDASKEQLTEWPSV